MSDYTVSVREIFHHLVDYKYPVNDYKVLEDGLPVFFDRQIGSDDTFWNILTHGIIRHFWMDEIGQETPSLWKWYLYDTIENKYEKWYSLFTGWKEDNRHFLDNLNVEKEIHEREQIIKDNEIHSNTGSIKDTGTVGDKGSVKDTGTVKNDGNTSSSSADTGTVKNDGTSHTETGTDTNNSTMSNSSELDENRLNDTPQTIITVGDTNQYLTEYTQRDHSINVVGTDTGKSNLNTEVTDGNTETRDLHGTTSQTSTNTQTLNTSKDSDNTRTLNTQKDTSETGSNEKNGKLNEDITITRTHNNYTDYSRLLEELNVAVPWLDVVYSDCNDLFMQLLF